MAKWIFVDMKKDQLLRRETDLINTYAFLARRDFLRAAAFLWISPFEAALSKDL